MCRRPLGFVASAILALVATNVLGSSAQNDASPAALVPDITASTPMPAAGSASDNDAQLAAAKANIDAAAEQAYAEIDTAVAKAKQDIKSSGTSTKNRQEEKDNQQQTQVLKSHVPKRSRLSLMTQYSASDATGPGSCPVCHDKCCCCFGEPGSFNSDPDMGLGAPAGNHYGKGAMGSNGLSSYPDKTLDGSGSTLDWKYPNSAVTDPSAVGWDTSGPPDPRDLKGINPAGFALGKPSGNAGHMQVVGVLDFNLYGADGIVQLGEWYMGTRDGNFVLQKGPDKVAFVAKNGGGRVEKNTLFGPTLDASKFGLVTSGSSETTKTTSVTASKNVIRFAGGWSLGVVYDDQNPDYDRFLVLCDGAGNVARAWDAGDGGNGLRSFDMSPATPGKNDAGWKDSAVDAKEDGSQLPKVYPGPPHVPTSDQSTEGVPFVPADDAMCATVNGYKTPATGVSLDFKRGPNYIQLGTNWRIGHLLASTINGANVIGSFAIGHRSREKMFELFYPSGKHRCSSDTWDVTTGAHEAYNQPGLKKQDAFGGMIDPHKEAALWTLQAAANTRNDDMTCPDASDLFQAGELPGGDDLEVIEGVGQSAPGTWQEAYNDNAQFIPQGDGAPIEGTKIPKGTDKTEIFKNQDNQDGSGVVPSTWTEQLSSKKQTPESAKQGAERCLFHCTGNKDCTFYTYDPTTFKCYLRSGTPSGDLVTADTDDRASGKFLSGVTCRNKGHCFACVDKGDTTFYAPRDNYGSADQPAEGSQPIKSFSKDRGQCKCCECVGENTDSTVPRSIVYYTTEAELQVDKMCEGLEGKDLEICVQSGGTRKFAGEYDADKGGDYGAVEQAKANRLEEPDQATRDLIAKEQARVAGASTVSAADMQERMDAQRASDAAPAAPSANMVQQESSDSDAAAAGKQGGELSMKASKKKAQKELAEAAKRAAQETAAASSGR